MTQYFTKIAGTINCEVPHGSIFGSLLFFLYINDNPQALSNSHTYLYADDTSISYPHKDFRNRKYFKQGICECVRMVY